MERGKATPIARVKYQECLRGQKGIFPFFRLSGEVLQNFCALRVWRDAA